MSRKQGEPGRNAERVPVSHSRDSLVLNHLNLAYSIALKFGADVPADDMKQEAVVALLKAADKFDESRGYAFSTFASVCIRNHLITYYNKHGRLIKIPTNVLKSSGGDFVGAYLTEESIEVPDSFNIEAASSDHLFVQSLVSVLTEREKAVIFLRFWHGMTLKSVGEVLSISRESVRKIEVEALAKMREGRT